MTTAPVISIARVLELGVPRSWQEAVAVAIEAGEAMVRSGVALSAERCVISSVGGLHVEEGRRGSGEPEAALRSILEALLEGQAAPTELRALVTAPADAAPTSGLQGLLSSLAYFERPQREADIAALATRALAADAEIRTETELGRLRRGAPRASREAPPATRAPRIAVKRKTMAVAIAVLAWFLVGLAATGWYVRRAMAPSPAQSDASESGSAAEGGSAADASSRSGLGGVMSAASEAMDRAAKAGLRAIGLVAAEDTSAPPARPPVPKATSPAARAAVPPAANASPSVLRSSPSGPGGMGSPIPELPAVAAEPPSALSPPDPTPVFFSESDTDVQPPMLVYPQLPIEASPAGIKPGASYFELLVNEAGTVERVRLMAAQTRFQDRMMVSAAKAWRFRPAMKDGRAVRYLLRTPTTE